MVGPMKLRLKPLPTFSPLLGRRAWSVRATPVERTRALPGDELIEKPIGSLHHAVTIRRPRPEVWPWLAQMGAGSCAGLSLAIDAATVDTNNADRDQHLRSDDFFAADAYPTITFASSRVVRTGPETYDVTGTLTIRGIAREITLPVTYLGTARDPWGNARAAFETEITINRKEFGLLWNTVLETGGFLVGDDVRISLSIQAIAEPDAL